MSIQILENPSTANWLNINCLSINGTPVVPTLGLYGGFMANTGGAASGALPDAGAPGSGAFVAYAPANTFVTIPPMQGLTLLNGVLTVAAGYVSVPVKITMGVGGVVGLDTITPDVNTAFTCVVRRNGANLVGTSCTFTPTEAVDGDNTSNMSLYSSAMTTLSEGDTIQAFLRCNNMTGDYNPADFSLLIESLI